MPAARFTRFIRDQMWSSATPTTRMSGPEALSYKGFAFPEEGFAAPRLIWESCRALRKWGHWIILTTFPAFLVVVTFTNGLPLGLRERNRNSNDWRLLQLRRKPTHQEWVSGKYRRDWSRYPPTRIVQPTQSRSAGFAATATISRLRKACLPRTPG